MAQTFELEVATPERLVVRSSVSEAQIPAAEGMIGVLPDHAALMSELGTGTLSYTTADARSEIVVCCGFLEIRDNHVRVLANTAEPVGEVDVTRAQEALKRAAERLALPSTAGVDVARALNAKARAEARIAVAKGK